MLNAKKIWSNPEITDLSVIDTKGGPNYTVEADGDPVYNADTKTWWTPSGKS